MEDGTNVLSDGTIVVRRRREDSVLRAIAQDIRNTEWTPAEVAEIDQRVKRTRDALTEHGIDASDPEVGKTFIFIARRALSALQARGDRPIPVEVVAEVFANLGIVGAHLMEAETALVADLP